jgi:hypothetical protein
MPSSTSKRGAVGLGRWASRRHEETIVAWQIWPAQRDMRCEILQADFEASYLGYTRHLGAVEQV